MKKMQKAEQYHRYHILSHGWSILYEPYRQLQNKEKAIQAQYQWNNMRRCYNHWLQLVDISRARDSRRYEFARMHYYAIVKMKALTAWQEGAQILKLERRAHLRRLEMRSKVDGWLRDDLNENTNRRQRFLLPLSKNPWENDDEKKK
jgi:hypothetical protein